VGYTFFGGLYVFLSQFTDWALGVNPVSHHIEFVPYSITYTPLADMTMLPLVKAHTSFIRSIFMMFKVLAQSRADHWLAQTFGFPGQSTVISSIADVCIESA